MQVTPLHIQHTFLLLLSIYLLAMVPMARRCQLNVCLTRKKKLLTVARCCCFEERDGCVALSLCLSSARVCIPNSHIYHQTFCLSCPTFAPTYRQIPLNKYFVWHVLWLLLYLRLRIDCDLFWCVWPWTRFRCCFARAQNSFSRHWIEFTCWMCPEWPEAYEPWSWSYKLKSIWYKLHRVGMIHCNEIRTEWRRKKFLQFAEFSTTMPINDFFSRQRKMDARTSYTLADMRNAHWKWEHRWTGAN